jgi:plastocyanin
MRRLALTALSSLALGLLSSTPPVAAQDTVVVQALDDVFAPAEADIPAGATVTWLNNGRNPHTISADDGSFDSGEVPPGRTFTLTFDEATTVAYHCIYHGAPGGLGMAGRLQVGGGGGLPPELEDVPPPDPADLRDRIPLRVPQDHRTIQAAVDAATPGDLVLVSAGEYHESVRVVTPYLTIRGTDRNGVVLDGDFKEPNGIHVFADGVSLENMTARHFRLNGFYWTGVEGYRGSYLTAYNNGDYGLYAFDSVWGQFDHSYASGHPDSGFYIGQCYPCHAVITDVLAERNGLGYSGTNAGGDLIIANSEWRLNMSGIVPNTLDSELYPPQRETTIVGNWVHDNNNVEAPAKDIQYAALGTGILLAGGLSNVVAQNLVEGHDAYGIAAVPLLDRNFWITGGNRVEGNTVRGSGLADVAFGAPSSGANCFAGNSFRTSLPPAIEAVAGCGFAPTWGAGGDLSVTATLLGRFAEVEGGDFPRGDWRTQPAPPPQDSMAGALTAPPAPAADVPMAIDLGTVSLPAGDGSDPDANQEVTVLGVSLDAPSWWALLISTYGYVLPLILYASWVSVAMWDLVRREDISVGRRTGWMAGVLIVPVLGPIGYYAFGRSPIPGSLRLMLVAGGMLVYVVFAALAFLVAAS